MRLNAPALAALAIAAILTPLLSAPHQQSHRLAQPFANVISDLRARILSRRLRPGWQWLTEQCPDVVLDPPMRGGVARLARRIAECYEAADRLASPAPPNAHRLLNDALRPAAEIPPTSSTLAALLEVASQLHHEEAAPLIPTGARAHLAHLCEHRMDSTLHERALSLHAVFAEQAGLRSRTAQIMPQPVGTQEH